MEESKDDRRIDNGDDSDDGDTHCGQRGAQGKHHVGRELLPDEWPLFQLEAGTDIRHVVQEHSASTPLHKVGYLCCSCAGEEFVRIGVSPHVFIVRPRSQSDIHDAAQD